MAIRQMNMFAEQDDVQLILTYVPEAEYLTFDEALALAECRETEAAYWLLRDIWRHNVEEG